MGFDVEVASLTRKKSFGRVAKKMLVRTAGMLNLAGFPRGSESKFMDYNRKLLGFASRHMALTPIFSKFGVIEQDIGNRYDVAVVGSDQVWRPDYAPVRTYLLDFLGTQSKTRKISYAASFGKAEFDGSHDLIEVSKKLAQEFKHISVRERSGVALVESLWGLKATRVPDPTFLLESSEYGQVTGRRREDFPYLLRYVLDESESHVSLTSRLSTRLGLVSTSLPSPSKSYVSDHHRPSRVPAVEEWLGAIKHADFLLTDSFHGCVMAILFSVPFAVVVNESRGSTRFDTLLETFSLTSRIINVESELDEVALLDNPINWAEVSEVISRERALGREFLDRVMHGDD